MALGAAALLGLSAPVLAGCAEGSGEGEEAEAAEIEQASGGTVPAGLAAAESGAEDVVALALSRNRDALVARASELARTTTPSGLPAGAAAELKRRSARVARVARSGSFVEAALAANAVSGLMPGLYRRFESRVAAGILALDYLDREAELRSLAGEPQVVAAAVGSLARTWARIRPGILAAGGTEEARDYQMHVAVLRRLPPTAAAKIQPEVRRGLELVDRLEAVVRRSTPQRSGR